MKMRLKRDFRKIAVFFFFVVLMSVLYVDSENVMFCKMLQSVKILQSLEYIRGRND
jgi:hypothetical protein